MSTELRENPTEGRFELYDDGTLAALAEYTVHDGTADFTHTETLDGFGGRGLATQLIQGALDEARSRSWHVRPYCPFVTKFIGEHTEYVDLVSEQDRGDFGLS